MNTAAETALHGLIEDQQPNICQVTAYRDNKKVYSDTWNGYTPEDCVHIMSATKSVFALLYGIALDREQFIKDNQEAFKYGALEEFGRRDDHFEEGEEIISRGLNEQFPGGMFRFEKRMK